MATLLGTNTFRQQNLPQNLPPGQKVSGEYMEITGQYICTGTEVTADVLPLFKLPVGAIFRDLYVSTNAIDGTSVIISQIGDAGSANRYSSTSIPLTAAQTETKMAKTNANAVDEYVIAAGNETILATITGTFPVTAGKKITVRGYYRMP